MIGRQLPNKLKANLESHWKWVEGRLFYSSRFWQRKKAPLLVCCNFDRNAVYSFLRLRFSNLSNKVFSMSEPRRNIYIPIDAQFSWFSLDQCRAGDKLGLTPRVHFDESKWRVLWKTNWEAITENLHTKLSQTKGYSQLYYKYIYFLS
jgi:hypothetical protein